MIFKLSEDGGQTETPYLNDYDYIDSEWSDSIIKIILPYSISSKTTNNLEYPIGSGAIKIKKGMDSVISETELNVKFANNGYTFVSSTDPSNVLSKIPFRQTSFIRTPYNYTEVIQESFI